MRVSLRPALALVLATAAALLAPVLPADARPPGPVGDTEPLHLTLTLRTPRPGARASDAAKGRVVAALRRAGFTPEGETGSTVRIVGTVGAARQAFGAELVRDGKHLRPRAVRPLPASLAADVASVIGFDTRPKWRAHVIPDGLAPKDLRQAYQITPSVAAGGGTGRTVATVQFSGWHDFDLSNYASKAGIPNPVGTGRFAEIEISPCGSAAPSSTCNDKDVPDGQGGDAEVALDQEAILAAAPMATQRVYFAPNSDKGAVDLYAKIADDVDSYGIDAVSTSWGLCEDLEDGATYEDPNNPANEINARVAVDGQLAAISAAGATIFAASGDAGKYDCALPDDGHDAYDDLVDVDYPAANPLVLAVGGTSLYRTGSGRFGEDAWEDTLAAGDGYRGDGSGGGTSDVYDERPAYQGGTAGNHDGRMVPDIAAVSDPYGQTGGVYLNDYGWTYAGGTSYAAPLMAGGLVATLASIGRSQVGDLHQTLYRTGARLAMRDVTHGGGGGATYGATTGYDRVTGLGAPQWAALGEYLAGRSGVVVQPLTGTTSVAVRAVPSHSGYDGIHFGQDSAVCAAGGSTSPDGTVALSGSDGVKTVVASVHYPDAVPCEVATATVLLDRTNPRVAVSIAPETPPQMNVLRARWAIGDTSPSSGLDGYLVDIYKYGVADPVYSFDTRKTSFLFSGAQGAQYRADVVAVDAAGNASSKRWARGTIPWDDKGFSLSGRWSRSVNKLDYLGSQLASNSRSASATKVASGKYYYLVVTKHPTGGYVAVVIDGKVKKYISLYSPTVQHTVLVNIANYSTGGRHTVKLVVNGNHASGSSGNYVYVDGLRVTR